MRTDIQFGTDGWRALIADGFTVERLRVVAQSFADWLVRTHGRRARAIIGFDGRFGGERFALAAGRVLAANGIRTDVTSGAVPTPALSWWVVKGKYDGGLMITASHNPPAYNGVKVKPEFGGSPDESVIGPLVAGLGRRKPRDGGTVRRVDFIPAYDGLLRSLVDRRALRSLKGTVVHDPMGGVQTGRLDAALRGLPLRVVRIHERLDPMFCGLDAPEPVEKNLRELMRAVPRHRALLGIATDGDGDRVGIVAENGVNLSPHRIFALLLLFLLRHRKLTGGVVKTVSGSFLLDRIARAHGLKLHETAVGFKHICRLMMTEDIMIGGEESGGVAFRGHIPERDGILAGLLFLELLARSGKSCTALVHDLEQEFGASHYDRVDAHVPGAPAVLRRLIATPPAKLAGDRVARVNTLDGLKLILGNDAWLLFRASGTEPLLRIYAEAGRPAQCAALLRAGVRLAGVS